MIFLLFFFDLNHLLDLIYEKKCVYLACRDFLLGDDDHGGID